ncbi:MAG: aminopeptidase P family protein [Elusimicrobia bacterium]|nr:aminopeptidase P family protein [Elusimicrobiota bacterium]
MPTHYRKLRRALARRLPDGLICLSGGAPLPRNHDVEFVFRQGSDFLYLTGVEEANCHLVIDPKSGREILFMPRIDSHHRVWLGHVPGAEEARSLFQVGETLYNDQLPGELKKLKARHRRAYANPSFHRKFRKSLGLPNKPAALRDALDELRACKSAPEIELMKRANLVSGRAHAEAMRQTRAGQYEYQVQAVFEAACLREGLRHLAYPSIVAAGANSAVLHYHRNNTRLKEGDLLLLDGGAECAGYGADITRTFPASGRFTQRQKDIYSIVLETQNACIEKARPGVVSADLHVFSMARIAEGLKSLGLLRGEVSGLIESGAVRLFYPHGLTHMLGLDVHDVTGGKKRRMANPTKVPVRFVARLEPGFVITMEPGIYFIEALLRDPELRLKHKNSVDFEKADSFLNFGGVRIEDDIVIQEEGPPLNLTGVAKEIADVEEICRR